MPTAKRATSKRAPRTATKPRTVASLALEPAARGLAVKPLDTLQLFGAGTGSVVVLDGDGREYVRMPARNPCSFTAGGALGTHAVRYLNAAGKTVWSGEFELEAKTAIEDDKGTYRNLLGILLKTMRCYDPSGAQMFEWKGRSYGLFVHWILDHCHTGKGMQFFSPHMAGLVDILKQVQRDDGMIWSNVNHDSGPGYYDTAYAADGYAVRRDGLLLVRQPVENHCEYNYVDTIYMAWKGNGDERWMKSMLESACRALDYTVNDRARFNPSMGLLVRGYTIDSWDFQVEDEYSVQMGVGNAQRIDPDRTKMGVFMGDNTGYALACEQLAEMLECAGKAAKARVYRARRDDIMHRLTELAWNGRFFRHRHECDPSVKRNLGVDESAQVVMSNAYALNRGIPHEQCVAILKTYQNLKENLPNRSPGEWYAIYPPFGRGFGHDNGIWQYMNGGVHGHAAGELARGAFEHGFERYGADMLERLRDLGNRHGGTIKFAYTGAYEQPPAPQNFTPLDLTTFANMDVADTGAEGVMGWMGERNGNDMRNLPCGPQTHAGVPYVVADPATNNRRAVVAVSMQAGYAQSVSIPVGKHAGALYLLHAAGALGQSGIAASMTLRYEDGTESSQYIVSGKHITGWWFPSLKTPNAGIAWHGPNAQSSDVGVCWAALANPHPDKAIISITFTASTEGAKYALAGLTLADRMPYHEPDPVSFGGPDNWSGGCVALALIEGLAGVRDEATSYRAVRLSPRWSAAGVARVKVTVRYEASKGYVCYDFDHDSRARRIALTVTGSGDVATLRVLLPPKARAVRSVRVNARALNAHVEMVESSRYAVIPLEEFGAVNRVAITY